MPRWPRQQAVRGGGSGSANANVKRLKE